MVSAAVCEISHILLHSVKNVADKSFANFHALFLCRLGRDILRSRFLSFATTGVVYSLSQEHVRVSYYPCDLQDALNEDS